MATMKTTTDSGSLLKHPKKTALHQAVLDHRLHQVRLLVTKHGGEVDIKDMYGRTPLMLACLLDNEDDGYRMAKIFLEAGAYLNIKDTLDRSVLHYACMKGRVKMTKRFLRSELAEVSAKDKDGNTPIMLAALSGNPDVVSILVETMLQFGVSFDERNNMGYTALLLACKYGHYVSAHILLTETRASPALRDNEFFLNAHEWVRKSAGLRAAYTLTRSNTFHEAPRFSRENTMYSHSASRTCHHGRTPSHPLGQSLDAALRLPPIFPSSENTNLETFIEGKDAKGILVQQIQELMNSPKFRTSSRISRKSHSGSRRPHRNSDRRRPPPTAKLISLSPGDRSILNPDLRTLLDMYSDQYPTRLQIQRPIQSAPAAMSDQLSSVKTSKQSSGVERVQHEVSFAEP